MTVDITTALSRALGSSGGHTTVEVTLNATAKTKPTNRHVGLLIDTSGSMAGPKIQHAKRGAKRALRELDDDDYVSVVGFDAATETVLPMTNWGAVDHERAIADVDGIRSGGGTDIYKGLELVRDQLVRRAPDDTRSVERIILLSDGQDRYTPSTYRDLAAEFAADGISIMAAGVGSGYDDAVMVALATASGGQAANLSEDDIGDFLSDTVSDTDSVVAPNPTLEIAPRQGFIVDDAPAYFDTPKVATRPIDRTQSPTTLALPELETGVTQRLSFEMLGQPKSPGSTHEIAELRVVDSNGTVLGTTTAEVTYADASTLTNVTIEKDRRKAAITTRIQDPDVTDSEVSDAIDAVEDRGWSATAAALRSRLRTADEAGGLIKITNTD